MTCKEWFLAKELVGVSGMPKTLSSVSRKAASENWKKRQKTGVKGVAFEYHVDSFPNEARIELIGTNVSNDLMKSNRHPIFEMLEQMEDDFLDLLLKHLMLKGQERAVASERDQRMLDLVAELDDEQFREIFAYVRKIKYTLLAGLPIEAAIHTETESKRRA